MQDFRLTEKAVDDLRSIARYTQKKWGRDQRNKYLYMLDAGFNTVAQQPEVGVACDYIRSGYRKYHVGRHLIFYGTCSSIDTVAGSLKVSMTWENLT